MLTESPQNDYENGLRILARWIARAHLKNLASQQNSLIESDKNNVEVEDANQRNQRSDQVAPVGQDQVGTQEGRGGDELSGADGLLCLPRRGKKGLRRKTPSTQDHVSD